MDTDYSRGAGIFPRKGERSVGEFRNARPSRFRQPGAVSGTGVPAGSGLRGIRTPARVALKRNQLSVVRASTISRIKGRKTSSSAFRILSTTGVSGQNGGNFRAVFIAQIGHEILRGQ